MARVIFSALISDARGKIGDIVASNWKGIPYFRRRVTPANPRSGKQMLTRFCLKTALNLYQSVKSFAADPWDLHATGYAMSGYNFFMRGDIDALIPQMTEGGVGEDPTWSTPAITVGTPYNDAYPALIDVDAGTGGANKITFTWTARAGCAAANKVVPCYRLDDADAWTAQSAVLESVETVDITGLTDAEQYECMLVPYEDTDDAHGQSTHKLATAGA